MSEGPAQIRILAVDDHVLVRQGIAVPEASLQRSGGSESTGIVTASVEFVLRAALHDYVDADFVHSIAGNIIAEAPSGGEQDAARIGASLVQFSEALDHGISTTRLGDGLSGEISEYWEQLFDMETGYLKEEMQTEIVDYLEVYPKFRGLGIGMSVINRTIDVFGAGSITQWLRIIRAIVNNMVPVSGPCSASRITA